MQASWPRDGVVLVFCKAGKYWAGETMADLSDVHDILADLKEQAKEQQKKELQAICGKQVKRKLAIVN